MRTYCKKADPTNVEFIIPAVWDSFKGRWTRNDYGKLFYEYSGLTREEVHDIIVMDGYAMHNPKLAPGVRKIAEECARRIKARKLDLEPVSYEERRDPGSYKLRIVGIETPLHQVLDHIAVHCLKELFNAKIEPCQFASLSGKGAVKGAHTIAKWVRDDNKKAWYCRQNGFRFTRSTEYYVQGDVRKCYPSMKREMAMGLLRHDISKNETLLWLTDELLKMHLYGFIIGSLLSQFLCNYIMSFAIREAFGMTKERRGKKIRLVQHQIWYMDDFLLTGPDARNLKMAYTRLTKYMMERFGLELKPAKVYNWAEKSPDIMGYVIHSDGTITIRPRNYLKARRTYTRANGQQFLSIAQAHLIISYKGFFTNSDCTVATKELHVVEIAQKAQKLISDYVTGRLMQCITKPSSTAPCPTLSPSSSGPTVLLSTV